VVLWYVNTHYQTIGFLKRGGLPWGGGGGIPEGNPCQGRQIPTFRPKCPSDGQGYEKGGSPWVDPLWTEDRHARTCENKKGGKEFFPVRAP